MFLKPGTGAQIIFAILLCLGAMRVYAAKAFIDGEIDIISEGEKWQGAKRRVGCSCESAFMAPTFHNF